MAQKKPAVLFLLLEASIQVFGFIMRILTNTVNMGPVSTQEPLPRPLRTWKSESPLHTWQAVPWPAAWSPAVPLKLYLFLSLLPLPFPLSASLFLSLSFSCIITGPPPKKRFDRQLGVPFPM